MKKLAIILLLIGSAFGQCKTGQPETGVMRTLVGECPMDQPPKEHWNGTPDSFLKLGNGQRYLHPDKKSWAIFASTHALMWGAAIYAIRHSATTNEDAHSEYPAIGFITGIDLLVFKTLSPLAGSLPPLYGAGHYIYSSR